MRRYLVFPLHGTMGIRYLSVLDEDDARDLLDYRPSREEEYGRAGVLTLWIFDHIGNPAGLARDPSPLLKALEEIYGDDPEDDQDFEESDPRPVVFVSDQLEEENPGPCERVSYLGRVNLLVAGWHLDGVSFAGKGLEGWLDWDEIEAFLEGRTEAHLEVEG